MVIKLLLKHFAFKQKHIDSFEEGPTLLWVEQVAADASQVGLEFREGHLDGIEIGAVSRQ